jgi:pSer/pThr/pTyr-binding forkhead associated (FHA) protein
MIVVLNTGEKYRLRSGQNRIGRGEDTDLQVQSGDVSRHHAVIAWEGDQARVMDMGSTNGTFLNGEKLAPYEYLPLKSGDRLDLGTGEDAVRLVFEDEAQSQAVGAAATVMLNLKEALIDQPQAVPAPLSPETVSAAYDALASGDLSRIRQHWDDGISWWVPGSSPIAGWQRGLEAFIAYLRHLAALSGNSLRSETQSVLTGSEQAAVLLRVSGYRAGYNENNSRKPHTRLDVELVQVLRWQNGKIVEGRTAIFGEGLAEYDQFWSALPDEK